MKKSSAVIFVLFLILALVSCAPSTGMVMDSAESQVKLRNIQSRAFDTSDKEKTLRTVIATLQDLGFIIDKADLDLGMVSGTKLNFYAMRMTVSVRPRGDAQMIVRANAQYQLKAVEDPEPYQAFFNSLSKAMFLAAQNVD
ncbi:MAG TPA: hypothetical protein PK425_09205 [Syntrophales bacterium]|jgi:hypothetical protein|nr:hypothetical protein [Syntrophales bacterium]